MLKDSDSDFTSNRDLSGDPPINLFENDNSIEYVGEEAPIAFANSFTAQNSLFEQSNDFRSDDAGFSLVSQDSSRVFTPQEIGNSNPFVGEMDTLEIISDEVEVAADHPMEVHIEPIPSPLPSLEIDNLIHVSSPEQHRNDSPLDLPNTTSTNFVQTVRRRRHCNLPGSCSSSRGKKRFSSPIENHRDKNYRHMNRECPSSSRGDRGIGIEIVSNSETSDDSIDSSDSTNDLPDLPAASRMRRKKRKNRLKTAIADGPTAPDFTIGLF